MRDFRRVKVWEEFHKFTLKIYQITKTFPKEELFGLTSQMRRSCSSIPTNIAEGCGRGTNKDYAHFLQMALGSAYELDYQLLLARDLDYLDGDTHTALSSRLAELERQLAALLQKVRAAS